MCGGGGVKGGGGGNQCTAVRWRYEATSEADPGFQNKCRGARFENL